MPRTRIAPAECTAGGDHPVRGMRRWHNAWAGISAFLRRERSNYPHGTTLELFPVMTTADDQIEYLPLFVYGTLLERSIRDSVLGQPVLRTERAATQGRWEKGTDCPAVSFHDRVSEISGELVWLVPERFEISLQRADQYEGVPRLYRRVRIRVQAGEKEVQAYAYEWARSA
jgi:gamma-glutamylcyclotransferase (GGCT)/AIG2-like uncharacterized protein YtfP